jgi:hypothetical protein
MLAMVATAWPISRKGHGFPDFQAADHIPERSRNKRIQAPAYFSCPLAPK